MLFKWSSARERAAILETLEEKGISLEELMAAAKQPDADPFDLLCHVAFNAPLRTRRERAEALRREQKEFFDGHSTKARFNPSMRPRSSAGDAIAPAARTSTRRRESDL